MSKAGYEHMSPEFGRSPMLEAPVDEKGRRILSNTWGYDKGNFPKKQSPEVIATARTLLVPFERTIAPEMKIILALSPTANHAETVYQTNCTPKINGRSFPPIRYPATRSVPHEDRHEDEGDTLHLDYLQECADNLAAAIRGFSQGYSAEIGRPQTDRYAASSSDLEITVKKKR